MVEEKVQVFKFRWIVLILFMLGSSSLQVLWISFAPVTIEAAIYYNVGEFEIIFLSTVFMITYIPVSFIATWILNKFGFRIGVGLGVMISGVFGFLRALVGQIYILVLLMQTMISISQPFFLNSVSLLSANWFPESKRTTATGFSITSQFLGIALGMFLTPIITIFYSFEIMMQIYGLSSLIIAIIFVILVRDKPPTPPSINFSEENKLEKGGTKFLLSNKKFWLLIIIYFINFGAFYVISTFIELIAIPRGLTTIEGGNLGALFLFGGISGILLISFSSDKLQKRVLFMKVSLLICFISFFVLSFAYTRIIIFISGFCLGFGLISLDPVIIEYAVDISVPVPESSSNGVLALVGSISGIIFILIFEKFTTLSGDYLPTLFILSILSILTFLLTFFLKDVNRFSN